MGKLIRNGITYGRSDQIELSQAEYNALPSSKLTNGVTYYIKDVNSSVGGATLPTDKLIFTKGSPTSGGGIEQLSDSELQIYSPTSYGTTNNYGQYVGTGLSFRSCANGILPLRNSTNNGRFLGSVILGSSTYRFGTIYCATVSQGSDKKEKIDIESLNLNDVYEEVFNNLDFVKYRWKYNQNFGLADKPSKRFHYGIIAQDVEKLFKESGLDNSDNGIIKANFFLNNTSDRYICGGFQLPYYDEEKSIHYNYSENVWKYKHDLDYEVYNEVIEENISKFTNSDGYRDEDRSNIGYIMIEDNSKVAAENYHAPIKINSVILIDKEGNPTKLELNINDTVAYYDENDIEMSNPLSSAIENEDGSITIEYKSMYSKHMIGIKTPFNIHDYESIILDIDYIGEYKFYLLPKETYNTTNFLYDIERVGNTLVYDYSVDYTELIMMCLSALQSSKKKYEEKINNLEERLAKLEERLE